MPPGLASTLPAFCFISSPSHHHHLHLLFSNFFFLTDKRVLSEPKSHRKCSFHGHFVSLCGIALALFCCIHCRAPQQLWKHRVGRGSNPGHPRTSVYIESCALLEAINMTRFAFLLPSPFCCLQFLGALQCRQCPATRDMPGFVTPL